ncbi:MATE family efflux transporter [Arthrobacter sp. TMS1-12-1]
MGRSVLRILPVGLAAVAPCTQAAGSLLLILVASRTMDLAGLGRLSLLYGFLVLASGLVSGFVGDSLTVLDRAARPVRGALQAWFLILAGSGAVFLAGAGLLAGFTDPVQSLVLGLAGFAFVSEEVVRRLLMAELRFGRVTLVDLAMIVGTGLALLAAVGGGLHLIDFVHAILVGQVTGALAGVLLLPRPERYLVPLRGSALRQVARFGVWRAAQQGLRPTLLTGLRFVVILFVGLAAAGELEVARVYAAPALLLVGGFSSFLFSSYARDASRPLQELVSRADRAVAALAVFTLLGSAVALLLLPVAGPMLTGRTPDPTAVTGWLCLTLGIGASIPYGSLAAVRGRASTVFGVRLGESVLSLALAGGVVALSDSFVLAPLCAALGSVGGAVVLRVVVLARPVRVGLPAHSSGAPPTRGPERSKNGTVTLIDTTDT